MSEPKHDSISDLLIANNLPISLLPQILEIIEHNRQHHSLLCPRCAGVFHEADILEKPDEFWTCPFCHCHQHAKCRSPLEPDFEIADLRAKLAAAEAELTKVKAQSKIDNEGNQEWINSLCEQLCKMEDALGFKNDCYDKEGKWVPTIGPWMERVRDLLATEGELGDMGERLSRAESELSALREDKARADLADSCGLTMRWSDAFGIEGVFTFREAADAARAKEQGKETPTQ